MVKFHKGPISTSVGNVSNVEHLSMYPNPTTGKFTVEFTATDLIKNVQITVTNLTGQQIQQRSFNNTTGQFTTELDLTNEPRGVYFVEFMADGQRMIQKMVVR
ncbi:MAG TPA: T9SS type A sorting domain-containing protein [Flavipsychrobacter sp.]|nr:T9SS type A sorting domain-containing protein [Flavipsychrobacter sp.]